MQKYLLINLLVACRQDAQVCAREVRVFLGANFYLHVVHGLLEVMMRDLHYHGAKHMEEPAVRVPSEALTERFFQRRSSRVVQS